MSWDAIASKNEMIKQNDSIRIENDNLALSVIMQFSRLSFISSSPKFLSWTELSYSVIQGICFNMEWMNKYWKLSDLQRFDNKKFGQRRKTQNSVDYIITFIGWTNNLYLTLYELGVQLG